MDWNNIPDRIFCSFVTYLRPDPHWTHAIVENYLVVHACAAPIGQLKRRPSKRINIFIAQLHSLHGSYTLSSRTSLSAHYSFDIFALPQCIHGPRGICIGPKRISHRCSPFILGTFSNHWFCSLSLLLLLLSMLWCWRARVCECVSVGLCEIFPVLAPDSTERNRAISSWIKVACI